MDATVACTSFAGQGQQTLEMCTPRRRCTPEHSMHRVMPRLREAQVGSGEPQSAHRELPGTRRRTAKGSSGEEGRGGRPADPGSDGVRSDACTHSHMQYEAAGPYGKHWQAAMP